MDLHKRLLCWAASAIFSFMAFSNIFQIDSEAAVTDIVQLTPQQTVALFGDTVESYYYTNSNIWEPCTFTYLGTVSGLATNGGGNLSTAGYSDNDKNLLFNSYWVWYGCPAASLTNPKQNDVSFQFRFIPSINIQGIAYYRQILASVRNATHGSGYDPWRSEYRAACTVSYSPTPVAVYARGLNMQSTDSAANVYFTPSPIANNPFHQGFTNVVASPEECAFCDVYLQDLDSQTGQENTFSFTGLTYRPNRCPAVIVNAEVNGSWQQTTYYLFALSCPRVTDGYVMPDVPTTAPDYSGQLDDIISQGAANQTILQQILAKLDLIYAQMQNTSNEVSIVSSSVNAIVNGIKNLFIPTETDLVNFRLSLMQELQSSFPAFYTAESSIHDAYDIFDNVEPVSSVRFPGVSVGFPSGSGTETAVFSIPAQDIALKPESNRLQPLYDALAWIIDIICTLSVFNMVKHKFHRIFEGGVSD